MFRGGCGKGGEGEGERGLNLISNAVLPLPLVRVYLRMTNEIYLIYTRKEKEVFASFLELSSTYFRL